MELREVSRTERFSWEEQFWWKNTASDLRLLGTREEPGHLGRQKRERMGTLAKGAWMWRKGTLNVCPQLFLELR